MGTLWDTSVETNDLQQTLVTSNGGCITQCYNQAAKSVSLGSNLQYNLYQLAGFLDSRTNPFTFVAGSQGTGGVTPGYFMISYHYVFKNPIGSSWTFVTDWNAELLSSYDFEYVSAIPLAEDESLNPAELIHFKNGEWLYTDDTPLPTTNYSAIKAAVFACTPSATVRSVGGGDSPEGVVPWQPGRIMTPAVAYRGSNTTDTWQNVRTLSPDNWRLPASYTLASANTTF